MASTVIVGSGVMGASLAYHLAMRGQRDVLVLDRGDGPGAGSTGARHRRLPRPVRHGDQHPAVAARTGEAARLPARHRHRSRLPTVGYLWLADTPSQLETLRACQRLQVAEGLVEAMELEDEHLAWLNPALDRSGIAGAVFCPTDGYIRPFEILRGYIHAATRLGVRFEWNTVVEGIDRAPDGTVRAARTASGLVPADRVVNAAGAWAGAFGRACGLEVPVVPLRRQVAQTVPTDALPAGMPMTIFVGDGFHLRVRDGRVLLLWPTPGVDGAPFDDRVDDDWIDAVAAKAHARVPALKGVPIDRARRGPASTRCRPTSTRCSGRTRPAPTTS